MVLILHSVGLWYICASEMYRFPNPMSSEYLECPTIPLVSGQSRELTLVTHDSEQRGQILASVFGKR